MAIPYGRQAIDDADVEASCEVLRGDWLTQGPAVAAFEDGVRRARATRLTRWRSHPARRRCTAPRSPPASARATSSSPARSPSPRARTAAPTSARRRASPTSTRRPGTSSADSVLAGVAERTRAVVPVHFAGLPAPVEEIRAAVRRRRRGDRGRRSRARRRRRTASRSGPAGIRTWRSSASTPSRRSRPARAAWSPRATRASARPPAAASATTDSTQGSERLTRDDGPLVPRAARRSASTTASPTSTARSGARSCAASERSSSAATRSPSATARRSPTSTRSSCRPAAPAGLAHAYHLFVVRHREGAEARRRLYDGLRERGHPRAGALPARLPGTPGTANATATRAGLCPEAERYYEGCLSLPCFPTLTARTSRTGHRRRPGAG